MQEPTSEHRVRLISQGFNTWKVQVLFSQKQMNAAEISEQLAVVKSGLAYQFGVPNDLLEYGGLLDKRSTRNGLLVTMRISKRTVPAGTPRLRSASLAAPDGTLFRDMILEADLFPFDDFDKPLTRSTIESLLVAEHIDQTCVDWPRLEALLTQLQENGVPVLGVEIGRGQLPSIGNSSRIIYGTPDSALSQSRSAWIGGFPVSDGAFLAEVSPATGGFVPGRNIYGRELAPRVGIETTLEAGEGTRLCVNGRSVKAARDGLVVFERSGRDRRDRDGFDLTPFRLRVRVLPALFFNEPQRFDLSLCDAAIISTDLQSGSRVISQEAIYIKGQISPDCVIESSEAIRVVGHVQGATLRSQKHICVIGDLVDCEIEAGLSLHIEGRALDSRMKGLEVIAQETVGGSVEAVKRTDITHVLQGGNSVTDIRIDLRRFLESQQTAGLEAIGDIRKALAKIVGIFGAEVVSEVQDGSVQRALLRWLRLQKGQYGGNLSHQEIREYRAVLELVPLIRAQLAAIGIELRDVTARLEANGTTRDQSSFWDSAPTIPS